MCNCLLTLAERGFIERETVYEDEDFKEKGFQLRKYRKVKGGLFMDVNHVFRLNYCPACGKKIPKNGES